MKKRLLKKYVKNMSDNDLCEHVAYQINKRLRKLVEKEFDKRFKEIYEQEAKLSEELMHISCESDKLIKQLYQQ